MCYLNKTKFFKKKEKENDKNYKKTQNETEYHKTQPTNQEKVKKEKRKKNYFFEILVSEKPTWKNGSNNLQKNKFSGILINSTEQAEKETHLIKI